MVKQRPELLNQEHTLLYPPSKKEADRRAYIRAWLQYIGIPDSAIQAEYTTSEGSIDLYLTNRRIIIEVKKADRLKNDPYVKGTGSKQDESAFKQLERYVEAERKRETLFLEDKIKKDHTWIGIVTDCRTWWIWTWDSYADNPNAESKKDNEWFGQKLNESNIKNLAEKFKRIVGKEWATPNMTNLFDNVKNSLMNYYKQRENISSTKTQKGLWLEQLKGGGNEPIKNIEDIFVIHTMLILISRLVSNNSKILDGFVQWVSEYELNKIKRIIDKYNWRQQTGDILRALYEHYIPRQHRLVYGEYYTPDWLAEKICQEVIDDEFIMAQIGKYNKKEKIDGILDPTCGSGVFLYYAAKRIMEFEYLQIYEESDIVDFICKIIHGIDIHPVAVEMAKANILRLFPNVDGSNIKIYQGDALMTPRQEAQLYGYEGDLPLVSPRGDQLIIPRWFLENEKNISLFVESACADKEIPLGLSASEKGYDFEELKRIHNKLKNIIQKEGNGVWKWYILNQAGPMKLKHTIGRIIANPPWVTFDKLQIPERKEAIKELAKQCQLWIGGKHTKFDIATLFVDRCTSLYMLEDNKSGWVLPHNAMSDKGGWNKMYKKIDSQITAKWNMGNLPFSTNSCVLFFNVPTKNQKLVKIKKERLDKHDSFDTIKKKTMWTKLPKEFPDEASNWLTRNGSAIARRGANITPHCLSWITDSKKQKESNMINVTTKQARWEPWKSIGTMNGDIPKNWMKETISSHDLVPYIASADTYCILPIKNNDWDSNTAKNKFWKELQDQYIGKKGKGTNTPKTLEDCLNYNNKLFSQFKRSNYGIVYNKSGNILNAAKIDSNTIIHDTLIYVQCTSDDEVYFILGILNSDALLPAFKEAQQTDRDFAYHIWYKIPLVRFDKKNKDHVKMAEYSKHAEKIARQVYDKTISKQQMVHKIREALRKDDITVKIDEICKKLFPDHTA